MITMNTLTNDIVVDTLKCKLDDIAKLHYKNMSLLVNIYVPVSDKMQETGAIDVDSIADLFKDMHVNYTLLHKKLETILAIVESEPSIKEHEEALSIVEKAKLYDDVTDELNTYIAALVFAIDSDRFSYDELFKLCMDTRQLVDCYIRFM